MDTHLAGLALAMREPHAEVKDASWEAGYTAFSDLYAKVKSMASMASRLYRKVIAPPTRLAIVSATATAGRTHGN